MIRGLELARFAYLFYLLTLSQAEIRDSSEWMITVVISGTKNIHRRTRKPKPSLCKGRPFLRAHLFLFCTVTLQMPAGCLLSAVSMSKMGQCDILQLAAPGHNHTSVRPCCPIVLLCRGMSRLCVVERHSSVPPFRAEPSDGTYVGKYPGSFQVSQSIKRLNLTFFILLAETKRYFNALPMKEHLVSLSYVLYFVASLPVELFSLYFSGT